MKEENINKALATARSSNQKKKRVKHVERRKRLNDTYIKSLKPKDKLYSIGGSIVVGLDYMSIFQGQRFFIFLSINNILPYN